MPEGTTTQEKTGPGPAGPRWGPLLAVALLGFGVWGLWPRPAEISPEGWRLFAIFAATIAGLVLRPLPVGPTVLISLAATALTGALDFKQALEGYATTTVWLVLSAFLISRALIKTGLARRIALWFVRAVGKTSLGIAYSLILSDLALATVIPANSARAGGVILPITRSLAELYGSYPGKTAGLLGTFLMVAVYQGDCIVAAMFLTGQAGNLLAAELAGSVAGFELTWARWAWAGLVPGLVSVLTVPWLVSKWVPLKTRRTPEAAEFARTELEKMGPLDGPQKAALAVFVCVCSLWVTSGLHGLGVAMVALLGVCALFLTGVLTWEDALRERMAWDVFIWFGGVIRLGQALNDYGLTELFARTVGSQFSGLGWAALLVLSLLIYFYAHYGFASITMHILSMFPPFVALLLGQGAPVGLVVIAFACLSNLAAGLTHYGTTPAPMYFSQNYASFNQWWRVGFLVSLWNLAVWGIVGSAWWKLIGLW